MITRRLTKYTINHFSDDTKLFTITKSVKETGAIETLTLTKVEAASFARFVFSIGMNYLLSGIRWKNKK